MQIIDYSNQEFSQKNDTLSNRSKVTEGVAAALIFLIPIFVLFILAS